MTTDQPAPHRVMLHIGAPKSGTTFLQRALWSQRRPLREAGVSCPGTSGRDMFLAAIEVREAYEHWGQDPEVLAGTWARMCEEARAFPGTTIMSHELLCAATAEQAERALAALSGLEVHLVYTARDLARQLMSEWQERVKNGSSQRFEEFQKSVMTKLRRGDAGLFWRHHGLLDAIDRWGVGLPPEHVHVVVAPPPGGDPAELWHRFGAAVGFDGHAFDPAGGLEVANQSLGVVQVAALRRVNRALGGRIRNPDYARVVKRQFAQDVLAQQASERPSCPPELVAELREAAEEINLGVVERGYRVHGDLAELLPAEPLPGAPAPDDVDPAQEADVLATVVADILVDRSRRAARRRLPEAATAGPRAEGTGLRSVLRRARAVAGRRITRR